MCLVERGWEENVTVTEKQPTHLRSISELIAMRMRGMWGSSVIWSNWKVEVLQNQVPG